MALLRFLFNCAICREEEKKKKKNTAKVIRVGFLLLRGDGSRRRLNLSVKTFSRILLIYF